MTKELLDKQKFIDRIHGYITIVQSALDEEDGDEDYLREQIGVMEAYDNVLNDIQSGHFDFDEHSDNT